MKVGAWRTQSGVCAFTVWAPSKKSIQVKVVSPEPCLIDLRQDSLGYWHGEANQLASEARYMYVIDNKLVRPDPASFFQPHGVHEPSCVVDHSVFKWSDQFWQGLPLEDMILYELHVGTFSQPGTFEGVVQKLDYLKKLGITAIELMPVAQFPGGRNWGYDGVYPFAVQDSYGGPQGLKGLIDECHKSGIAVVLDVVYNHLGPEGNYLADFAPYFTQKYQTPWGWALNFDGAYSDGVRNYFIQNVLYWFNEYHIDALRLDAVHGIFDFSAKHILKELAEETHAYSLMKQRKHYLIAESDLNDTRVIEAVDKGGWGNDAQWLDDFHHSLRALITRDTKGYYCDFGDIEQFAKSYREGFVYDWAYSKYRKKSFGSSSKHCEAKQFVVFNQNHDQVGNRMMGERLTQLIDFESLKLAAAATLFSPYIPMLFMGEEFAADTPFLYFISHLDGDLVKAVQAGRKEEFSAFDWQGEPPDPFAEHTYLRSKLKWESLENSHHNTMLEFYREMIRIRKSIFALSTLTRKGLEVSCCREQQVVTVHRSVDKSYIQLYMNFSDSKTVITATTPEGITVKRVIDSAHRQWAGPGSLSSEAVFSQATVSIQPRSFILYKK